MKTGLPLFYLKTTFLLIGFLITDNALSQCTTPITLGSQWAVDHFKSTYGCSVVHNQLFIQGGDIVNLDSLHLLTEVDDFRILNTSLTDLEGLSSLRKVNVIFAVGSNPFLTSLHGIEQLEESGTLNIIDNGSLINFLGLQSLRKINDYMWIYDNPVLSSFNGLQLLDSVSNYVEIIENPLLQSFTGLDNLKSVGSMKIQQNGSLLSLHGLGGLTTAKEGVTIFFNPALQSLEGLESLVHIGKRFWVSANQQIKTLEGLKIQSVTGTPLTFDEGIYITDTKITNLKGLEQLDHVNGRLYIGYNRSLTTLDGLDNLRYVNGHFGIEDNTILTSIDAIADLEYISGELELTDNDSLQICSIPSICSYLSAPAGLVLIFGNKPGCRDEDEILSNCSPVLDFHLIDANLEVDTFTATSGWIEDLPPAELLALTALRAGIATDGVSKVLFRVKTGTAGRMEIPDAAERGIEFPWGDTTHFIGGTNYTFFTYTAPDEFDEFEDIYMLGGAVEAFNAEVDYTFTSGTDVRQNSLTITHVRPPVVLMHGTYSDPDKAWKTAANGNVSMYDKLTSEGFKVFAVNYKESNGTTGLSTDISGFADNAKVIWGDVYPQNTGGIKDALTYYRGTLGVAATQADVVGHSLGGVLARVYASDHFNPEYKRAENFMEGDINRLITLGSTHFGSHLGELQLFLNGLSPFNLGALDWLALQGVNLVSDWVGGASPSHAVMDQLPPPMGLELSNIGRTEIPSHAIALRVPKGALRDATHDPDESYYDMYWYTTTLMYQMNDVRNQYLDSKVALSNTAQQANTTLTGGDPAQLYPLYTKAMLYKSMIEDAIHRAGTATAILDGTYELPTDFEIYKYALGEAGMGDVADPLLEIFVAGADPVGVALNYLLPDISFPSVASILLDQLRVNQESMEALRAVIFNNDDNDGIVRVQSQTGELEKECPDCVTQLDSVLHGFAPRYQKVQDKVVDLLMSNMLQFHPEGFPPVDHGQQLYYPSESLDLFKVPSNGTAAICQSGMPPSHAHAMARVADENNVIIIARPVNPDGNALILNNAATKSMAVKPKSSNWGPQKGFIPVMQRYSKIWEIYEGDKRTEKIAQYDLKAQENIAEGVVLTRPLEIKACNGTFQVFIDQTKFTGVGDQNAKDEVVLVPVNNPNLVCSWGSNFNQGDYIYTCDPRTPEHELTPLTVLASPAVFEPDGTTPRFITADYDLLMIGFNQGSEPLGDPSPPNIPFRPIVGQMTAEQEVLMGKINTAVAATGYKGGQVVHHGPENQFGASPYVDYPLTVFAPDNIPNGILNNSTGGLILSIKMGPPGFRDQNLKQFVNRMRRAGYDLYDNPGAPGWLWTWNTSAKAYNLEDAKNLGDYVEELPKSTCNKNGDQENPCPVNGPGSGQTPGRPDLIVAGNGNSPQPFTVPPSDTPRNWKLVDVLGRVYDIGGVESDGTISVDHDKLIPGMYFIVVDGVGTVARFMFSSRQ